MTWGEFKKLVESYGIADDFVRRYIDIAHSITKENVGIFSDKEDKSFYIED